MAKTIVFLKHIAIEGPGTLGAFFQRNGFTLDIRELHSGAHVPEDMGGFAALVVLGGPMNVYEEKAFQFLRRENDLVVRAIKTETPFLGICLGAQILAKAASARVNKSPAPEIGFFDVVLTEEGKRDPLFQKVDPTALKVFQWHEDMFDIPDNASWLGSSALCPHQACRVGKKAYGFQFHIEVDRPMIVSWLKEYWKIDDVLGHKDARKILEEYDAFRPQLDQVAEQIYRNFLSIIG